MSKRFIGLSILACAVLASSLLANGPDTPPTAEDVYGLKTWIEENVTAADVSAEIEGAVAAHAADTSTHGVSTVADAADVSAHVASAGTAVHDLLGSGNAWQKGYAVAKQHPKLTEAQDDL